MSWCGDEVVTVTTRVWRGMWRVWSGERRLERLEIMETEVLRQ